MTNVHRPERATERKKAQTLSQRPSPFLTTKPAATQRQAVTSLQVSSTRATPASAPKLADATRRVGPRRRLVVSATHNRLRRSR